VVGFVSGTGEGRSGRLKSADNVNALGGACMLCNTTLCGSGRICAAPEELRRALAAEAKSFGLPDSVGAGLGAAAALAMLWLRRTSCFSESSLPRDPTAF